MPQPVTTDQLMEAARFLDGVNELAKTSGFHLGAHMEMYVDGNDSHSETLQYLFGVRWDGSQYVLERHLT